MRRIILVALTLVGLHTNQKVIADIRNGYEQELIEAEKIISKLDEIPMDSTDPSRLKELDKFLEETYSKYEELQENHYKTQMLIEMLRRIDPGLYEEMNTLKDIEGNDTHIYIKAVKDLGPAFLGINNLAQSINNPNVYTSAYGDHTVSVKVVYHDPAKAMWTLVHELGHVRYQVPNLASYMSFYMKNYKDVYLSNNKVGHKHFDPSHKSVLQTLKAFKPYWKAAKVDRKLMEKQESKEVIAFIHND